MWARKHGVVLTELAVGNVRALLFDRLSTPQQPKKTDEDAKANLYAQYGGKALSEAITETEPGDEAEEDGDE